MVKHPFMQPNGSPFLDEVTDTMWANACENELSRIKGRGVDSLLDIALKSG